MRTESAQAADLLAQAYDGEPGRDDAWHGASLRKLLADVDWEEARARPVVGGHTIWELVLHMAIWDEICVRRLGGERIATTTGSPGDWAESGEESSATWEAAVARLVAAQRALVAAVRALDDTELDREVAGWPWSYRLMIHGTLHHDVYHAGQIALLRRALRGSS
jgi:uncharacterized damage-inducible protein DinB